MALYVLAGMEISVLRPKGCACETTYLKVTFINGYSF